MVLPWSDETFFTVDLGYLLMLPNDKIRSYHNLKTTLIGNTGDAPKEIQLLRHSDSKLDTQVIDTPDSDNIIKKGYLAYP